MDCNRVRDEMLEAMAAGVLAGDADAHVRGCAECARLWATLVSVRAPLDEFAAPEVSPYFATRLRARLTEVKAEEAASPRWYAWLHSSTLRLAATGVLAIAFAVGVVHWTGPAQVSDQPVANTSAPSAVKDLQNLENNQELYSDLDVLDDLAPAAQDPGTDSGKSL